MSLYLSPRIYETGYRSTPFLPLPASPLVLTSYRTLDAPRPNPDSPAPGTNTPSARSTLGVRWLATALLPALNRSVSPRLSRVGVLSALSFPTQSSVVSLSRGCHALSVVRVRDFLRAGRASPLADLPPSLDRLESHPPSDRTRHPMFGLSCLRIRPSRFRLILLAIIRSLLSC